MISLHPRLQKHSFLQNIIANTKTLANASVFIFRYYYFLLMIRNVFRFGRAISSPMTVLHTQNRNNSTTTGIRQDVTSITAVCSVYRTRTSFAFSSFASAESFTYPKILCSQFSFSSVSASIICASSSPASAFSMIEVS